MLGDVFSYLYQFADVFAFLILSAAGLAIVFGMMGIINMAHGEFIMCGAYITVGLVHTGFPLVAAQLCGAIVAGLIGVLIEVAIVRRFYKRPEDSLLATWGLSLVVTQGTLLVIGSTVTGIGTPPGSFTVGEYSFSTYRMILFAASIAVLAFIYFVFMRTKFGVMARATMQDATTARALGVKISWIYAITFGLGAGLAGLCGGLYAPTIESHPHDGINLRRRKLCHGRGRWRECAFGHRPRWGLACGHSDYAERVARADRRADRLAHRRHSRHPGVAGRHHGLDEPSHALNLKENFLMLKLLNGPHTFGSGPRFWGGFLVVLALVLAYPFFATPYDVGNFAYFFIWLFMALGLCLMWGYGGIMSFGQTFFFGLAGYGTA